MSDTNEHEERNRAAKAYRLVRAAEIMGWTPEDVEGFSDESWRMIAKANGVKPPSDRTKAIVLHILRERSGG